MHDDIKGFNWMKYMWITCAAVPVAILVFNYCIFEEIIPQWFFDQYIVLTYASPNPISMFLSNYAHATGIHMLENLMSYVITIASIAIVAIIAIPYTNKKTPGMGCVFGTKTLVECTCIFFLLVPFLIAIVSIIAGNYLGIEGGLGFSGVVFAFEGYLVYIAEVIIIRKVQVILHQRDKMLIYFGVALSMVIPLSFVVGQLLTMYTNPTVHANYFAHTAGFIAGITIPFLLERRDR
jgi:hypothetical protein